MLAKWPLDETQGNLCDVCRNCGEYVLPNQRHVCSDLAIRVKPPKGKSDISGKAAKTAHPQDQRRTASTPFFFS